MAPNSGATPIEKAALDNFPVVMDIVYAPQETKLLKEAKDLPQMSWKELRELVGEEWLPGLNTPFDPRAVKSGYRLRKKLVLNIGQFSELPKMREKTRKYLAELEKVLLHPNIFITEEVLFETQIIKATIKANIKKLKQLKESKYTSSFLAGNYKAALKDVLKYFTRAVNTCKVYPELKKNSDFTRLECLVDKISREKGPFSKRHTDESLLTKALHYLSFNNTRVNLITGDNGFWTMMDSLVSNPDTPGIPGRFYIYVRNNTHLSPVFFVHCYDNIGKTQKLYK